MSNKTSDKNVGNKIKQQTENTIKYYKNIDNIEEVPIDILRAMYKDILSDYTRQKQINEEHRKLNGKLREKVKELEEEKAMLKRASNIAKEVNIEDVTDVINKSCKEFMSNYIPKQAAKDVFQNNRNELFGMTYLSKEQFRPYEMQIERINKIEQELIGEDK